MTFKDSFIALIIIVAWGLNFVVISLGVSEVPPLFLGGLRFLLVACVGSLFIKRPKTPLKWWFAYALPIGFLQFSFLFVAMALGMPSGLASLVLQSQALFTMLFALLLLKEGIRTQQLLAIAIAAGGLALIASAAGASHMSMIGFILTIVAASCWALGNISARTISQKGHQSNMNLVVWSAWIPPLPFFIASWFIEGPEKMKYALINMSWVSIGALTYLALVATILGYSLWSYLMGRYPANQVAPLTLGVPIVGLASSAIFLGENLALIQWLGVILVLFALLINTFGKRLLGR